MPERQTRSQQLNIAPHFLLLLAGVERSRAEQYRAAFTGFPDQTFVPYSGKPEKVAAQLSLIKHYLGVDLPKDRILSYSDSQDEKKFRRALDVAHWKALQPRRNRDGIHGTVIGDPVTSGGDINAFRWRSGQFVQEHKFDRQRTHFENPGRVDRVKRDLINEYCHEGIIQTVWDAGTHIINGTDHQFGDKIEVISEPVDRELLVQYLDYAFASGLFYTSNLHFAALECLIENGKVKSAAFLPKELEDQKVTFRQMRQINPTPQLLQQALHSVITNAPISYAQ
jgi:hypothetical protein